MQNLSDIVKNAYQRPDVRDLESQALTLYAAKDVDTDALREILQERKDIIDREFVYTEETAGVVKKFNDYLTCTILKAQKICNEELAKLMKECPEREPETRIEISFGDLPELHPVQNWLCNKYDESIWNIITDADIEPLWDRGNDAFMTIKGTLEPFNEKEKLLGLKSEDETWADVCHFPLDWADGIQLTMPFHSLQDHSYMSLYDFLFVNKFHIEGHHTFNYSKSQFIELENAHRHSFLNKGEIEKSSQCGCFSCGRVFDAVEVEDFTDEGETALCPYCGVDSVIGDATGIQLSEVFLQSMHKRWM